MEFLFAQLHCVLSALGVREMGAVAGDRQDLRMAKGSSSAPGQTSHYLCLWMQRNVAAGVSPQ